MVQQLGVVAFSTQLGQSLAALAKEVVGGGDTGIPLTERHDAVLLPRNIDELSAGIAIPSDEVRLYLAVREAAYQRLYAHVPWLRARVVGAVEEVARGLQVDPSRLQDALSGVDVADPSALQQLMSTGVLEAEDTEAGRAARARLETILALVEGWVDDVVDAAVSGRLAGAAHMRETIRRRRAAGGAAERAFGTLVGLQLRPKAMREAATVFAALRSLESMQARDGLWAHPDLLPTAEDLQDPLGFVESVRAPGDSLPDA
jgi:putative hydrolase